MAQNGAKKIRNHQDKAAKLPHPTPAQRLSRSKQQPSAAAAGAALLS